MHDAAMFGRFVPWRRQPTPLGDATPRQLAEYNTRDARDLFSHLLRRVRQGEEIVVAHAGRPVAKLVPYSGEATRAGLVRTQLIVEDVVVLGGDRRIWSAIPAQRPRRSPSGST
ncbi:MAG TPA: type II toxin-antitoxin system prevent-host-death family antitoxin [Gaiellaceae bacterium]|nr:type II toxin-antitoxin system prevent-host-death family antitoxin [Gaiellaceae bacterium]